MLNELTARKINKNPLLVNDPGMLEDLIERLATQSQLSCDLETTGLNWQMDEIHGVVLADADNEWFIVEPALTPFFAFFAQLIKDKNPELIFHNVKFDLHFLHRYGVHTSNYHDTMVSAWLVNENRSLKLKDLAHELFAIPKDQLPSYKDLLKMAKKRLKKKRMDQVSITDLDPEELTDYSCRDGRLTYDLHQKMVYELHKVGLLDYYNTIERPFTEVLVAMEEAGLTIDTEALKTLEQYLREKVTAAQTLWDELSGGVDAGSNPQLAKFLFETLKLPVVEVTPKGAPSTKALVLQRLKNQDKTGSLSALQNLRMYKKLLDTYVTNIGLKLDVNKTIHTTYRQTGTITGRLSSGDGKGGVNFQNLPTRSEDGRKIRELVTAPPGHDLIVIDYSQIELRLVAHYSKEPQMMQVFLENGDPHQATADLIKTDRQVGKTINFLWVYGGGPRKLADELEKNGLERPDFEQAKAWLESFDLAYPQLVAFRQRVIRYAKELGYVRTIAGRRRRLPELTSWDKALRAKAERQALNSLIQGSAGDIIKYAMLEIYRSQSFFGAQIINQVHDELMIICPESASKEMAAFAQRKMEAVKDVYEIRVPIVAEPGIGKNWVAAKGK